MNWYILKHQIKVVKKFKKETKSIKTKSIIIVYKDEVFTFAQVVALFIYACGWYIVRNLCVRKHMCASSRNRIINFVVVAVIAVFCYYDWL